MMDIDSESKQDQDKLLVEIVNKFDENKTDNNDFYLALDLDNSKKNSKNRTPSTSSSAYQSNSSSISSSLNEDLNCSTISSSINENLINSQSNIVDIQSKLDSNFTDLASSSVEAEENSFPLNSDNFNKVLETTKNISINSDKTIKTKIHENSHMHEVEKDFTNETNEKDKENKKFNKRKRLREKIIDDEDDDDEKDEDDDDKIGEPHNESNENDMDGATCAKKTSHDKLKKAQKKIEKHSKSPISEQSSNNRTADSTNDSATNATSRNDDSEHHSHISFDVDEIFSLSSSTPSSPLSSSTSSSTSSTTHNMIDAISDAIAAHDDNDNENDEEEEDDDDDDYGYGYSFISRRRLDSKTADKSDDKKKDEENLKMDELTYGKILKSVYNRQLGYPSSLVYGHEIFRRQVCSDINMIKRMGLYCEYDKHSGCVNSLHFNKAGNLVASGSDDLYVVIYDWIKKKEVVKFLSNHSSNIFQTKFLPNSGDSHLVTAARDGQVRLAQLSSTGLCRSHKKLAQHKGSVHKISLLSDSPHELYSCGEDGVVNYIDLRLAKSTLKFTVKHKSKKVGLNSINSNPLNSFEFCAVGKDPFVRIFDIRKIDKSDGDNVCLKKFRPENIKSEYTHLTCAVYNHVGTEIAASYSSQDIYLFDSTHSDGASSIKQYTGHRNIATVKGVNFFGPDCQYVVSGSDCGNIFMWDKNTADIVNVFHGDDHGVVNVVETHDDLPMLATSGLDSKVRLWMAHKKPESLMDNLPTILKKNAKNKKLNEETSAFDDGHLLWFLMQTLRRSHRESDDDSSASSSEFIPPPDDDDDEHDDDDGNEGGSGSHPRNVQCAAS